MGIKRPAPDANNYFDDDDDDDIPAVVRKDPREEEDKPRARRAAEEDDEAPVEPRARRRPAPEDDEEEPGRRDREAPRGGTFRGRPPRAARPDPHGEEENRRAVPRQRAHTEDDFEEEDEDVHAPASSRVAAGWGAAKAQQAEGGDFNPEFKLSEDPTLIKFLSDEPFAVYRQHFLREKDGKKSYICLGSGCPLCDDLGHTADKKYAFTVVDLSQDTYGASQLVAGPKLLRILETHNGGKYGPLSKHFWEITRIGQGLKTDYGLTAIRDRYLSDDYGLDPATIEKTLRKIKPFTAADIKETTKAELRSIAAELDS